MFIVYIRKKKYFKVDNFNLKVVYLKKMLQYILQIEIVYIFLIRFVLCENVKLNIRYETLI